MKFKRLNEELLQEMARIGYLDGYEIYIHTDDSGNIPHFHIWDRNSKGEKFHTCIQIKEPKYFHHTGKENILNSKQKKDLYNLLQLPYRKNINITLWQHLIMSWNDNNSNILVDENQEMPDYTKLK